MATQSVVDQRHASLPNHNNTNSMKHNPGISLEWTAREHAILEDGLKEYTSDTNLIRYAKIATLLPNKTVRDVALRCRWMDFTSDREVNKRKKEERKSKDKKERVIDSSANSALFTVQPNVPPHATPRIPTACDDGIPYGAIGGVVGEILEQNEKVIHQISANLESSQINGNINLFCQTRDNIIRILNDLTDIPEKMRLMPPLPVRINEELANTILPRHN